MNTKTGLLALGLFTFAGMVTISCGGSSDESSTTTGTSGKGGGTSTAGNTSTGGVNNPGSSSGGAADNSSGTPNDIGGTGTAAGTAGTNNNQGGAPDIGAGGAGPNPPGCPATMPADGTMCMEMQGMRGGCDYGTMNCSCRGGNGGDMGAWRCIDVSGAGGARPDFGNAICPANAKNGSACTGRGLCEGQRCFCNSAMTTCF